MKLAEAMAPGLTRNQRSVLDVLRRQGSCRTAYELLDELRDHGVAAATSVYRALEALIARGLVHRVESRNAFIACRHERHATPPALALCRGCERVEEIEPAGLGRRVDSWCRPCGFAPEGVMLEITGLCHRCRVEGPW